MSISVHAASLVRRSVPLLQWAGAYQRAWLLPDVFAGVALWAVMVPEAMAYASIVGVPPIMGLYSVVPGLLAYALLGTSRQLVVGPDTATGLISALAVGGIATQRTADDNTLTSTPLLVRRDSTNGSRTMCMPGASGSRRLHERCAARAG